MPVAHKILFPSYDYPLDPNHPPDVLVVVGSEEEIREIIANSRAVYGGVETDPTDSARWMSLPDDRMAIEELVEHIPPLPPSP